MTDHLPGFGEITAYERSIYDAGRAYERSVAQDTDAPKWTKPTFALAAAVTLWAMWAAGHVLTHTAEPTLELVLALIGAVSAVPIVYAWPKKTSGGDQ